MQEQIDYSEIIDLGFEEEMVGSDKVFFRKHGFEYTIITLTLTKKIYIDWEKETKLCQLIRMNSAKKADIMARMPIMNYNHLREIISFYTDDNSSVESKDPLFA